MATIEDAVASGCLDLFELPDWEPRLPVRPLWVADSFFEWADNTPQLHDAKSAIGARTLFEHLLTWFCDFRCGDKVRYGDIKRMMPNKKGVWHMYPPGLRLYGWCPKQESFVAVCGALVGDTKRDKMLNDKKRNEVTAFIKANGLQQAVMYGDFHAVFPLKG